MTTTELPPAHVNGEMPKIELTTDDVEALRAELKALLAEVEADREYRNKLRKLRDREETLKERAASVRGQIKELNDEFLKGYSPSLFGNPEQQTADDWRALATGVLQDHGLPATLVKKLGDNECSTLGQLSDLMNRATESGKQWFDVFNGIGPEKGEKIEAALESFWKANPQYGKEKADVPSEGES